MGAVPDLVRYANVDGVNGLLCDYEPADNYTTAHAQAYATFLEALATQLHAHGLELGFDVAGWGILDKWAVFAPLHVDFYTSMTPTYNAQNITRNKEFTTGFLEAVG